MTAIMVEPSQSPVMVEEKAGRSIADLLTNVSASRLSTWQQCRLKFWFRYISGIQRPKSAALHLGSSVHEVLKYWNKAALAWAATGVKGAP